MKNRKKIHSLASRAILSMSILMVPVFGYVQMKSDKYQLDTIGITQDNTILVVNGKEIKNKDLISRLLSIYGNQVLQILIDETLLNQAIEQQGTKVPAKEIAKETNKRLKDIKAQFGNEDTFNKKLTESGITVDILKKQIEIDFRKEKLVEEKVKIAEQEVKQYFETNREKLGTPETVHVQHILVSTQQEAEDLIIALNAGADFNILAKTKSLDTATKDNGGDLGFYTKGLLQPQIEEVVFTLQSGQISPVVKSVLGFHILKVIEKTQSKTVEFNKEIKERIFRTLKQQKTNTALNEFLEELRTKAKIETK